MKKELHKAQHSTPDLHHLTDDPILTFDIPSLIEKIRHEDSWKRRKQNAMTLLKNTGERLMLIALQTGTEINSNQPGGSMSVQIIEGKLMFCTEKNSVTLEKGQLLTLHENIKHSLMAVEETVFLLTY